MKKLLVFSIWLFIGLSASSLFSDSFSDSSSSKGNSLQPPRHSNGPFFWSAEKDGQNLFLLGTIHYSVSLEDLICSEKIKERIREADIVFVENQIAAVKWNPSDVKTLRAGSKAEKEEILSKSPLKNRDRDFVKMLEEVARIEKEFLSLHYSYNNDERFEDLSRKTQDILISYGADERGNYLDYFALLLNHLNPYFSAEGVMDLEISYMAIFEKEKLKFLDDQTLAQIFDKAQKETEQEPRIKILIERTALELFAQEGYNQLKRQQIEELKKVSEAYKTGDEREIARLPRMANEKYFIEERNQLWAQKLKREVEEIGKDGYIFAAAGARHFIGNDSLLDMLREDGFLIRRMGKDCAFAPAERPSGANSKGADSLPPKKGHAAESFNEAEADAEV